jgi:circadian clock protein KaiB
MTATGTEADRTDRPDDVWELRLYVAGGTPRSTAAVTNLRRICEAHLPGRHRIEVVDVLERPELARGEQIVAIPTLERRRPAPVRKIIGDLTNAERVRIGLDLPSGAA